MEDEDLKHQASSIIIICKCEFVILIFADCIIIIIITKRMMMMMGDNITIEQMPTYTFENGQVENTNESDNNNEEEVHHNRTSCNSALPQILATCAKNLLLLTYGTTLGLSTIAIPALQAPAVNQTDLRSDLRKDHILSLTENQISWFSSINLICVPLGCFISGVITHPFGRRKSMMALCVPFMLTWILYYNATSVSSLYAALVICGLAGGIHEAPVLTYVAEITEPRLRGTLSSTAPTTVIVGSVSQLILGNFLHWRTVVLINMIFPIMTFIALCFVPESPHWLIAKGRIEEARRSLCWLRGWVQPECVEKELNTLINFIQSENRVRKPHPFKNILRPYTKRTFMVPYFMIAVIFFSGHFGGMMSLQTNSVKLFELLGTSIDPYEATLILGVVEFIGAAVCVSLVYRTGKRVLLMSTMSASGLCLAILSVYSFFLINKSSQYSVNSFTWIPIVFLNLTAGLLHAGVRLLPWVLVGEMFPTSIRGTASGASAFWFYIFAFIVNMSFYFMLNNFMLYGLFAIYALSLFFGSIFLYFFLPETEGTSLQQIEEHFSDKRNLFKTQIIKKNKRNNKNNINNNNCNDDVQTVDEEKQESPL